MENKETLEASAVVGEFADTIQDDIDNLLSNSVVSSGVVVGSVLLAADDLLGVVKMAVRPVTHFVAHSRLQVNIHSPWNMLARTSLGKESGEGVVAAVVYLPFLHGTIGINSVLKAVKLPAVVSNLNTGLAQMKRDAFW
jgi:hypothetical protein